VSTEEVVKEISAEASRLKACYNRAVRRGLGERKDGGRLGRKPETDSDLFILEARDRVRSERNFSASEIALIDDKLLSVDRITAQKKFWSWRSSYRHRQMCLQEEWENSVEAQRIGRLVVREGRLSAAEIQRARGLSKHRLDELTPLVLGLNLSLELRVAGLVVSAGTHSIAETQEVLRRVRGKSRTFKVLPAAEAAAKVSAFNRRQEERALEGLRRWRNSLIDKPSFPG
jgi:hypothetical protein